jgi:hypothetical protein
VVCGSQPNALVRLAIVTPPRVRRSMTKVASLERARAGGSAAALVAFLVFALTNAKPALALRAVLASWKLTTASLDMGVSSGAAGSAAGSTSTWAGVASSICGSTKSPILAQLQLVPPLGLICSFRMKSRLGCADFSSRALRAAAMAFLRIV